ncbi:hypothetical protein NM688_g2295 [Phlebia brevispora]|uniref:Uncharacterized protein n=1 Tax=Phlebia brevispora TaxID=194682 RepID=A0ACC1T9N8_9APHY|nr:hypothetical protein NM688_g2295 [Phlebia brevispora]
MRAIYAQITERWIGWGSNREQWPFVYPLRRLLEIDTFQVPANFSGVLGRGPSMRKQSTKECFHISAAISSEGRDLTAISIMDTSLYGYTSTSRGIGYNYYAFKAQQGHPTLLFLHGFPSTAKDWQYFVSFFKEKGYGIIAPDMLGYGDTDKPTDPSLYVSSKVSKDLVDILDAEQVDKAIVIGHDWGSKAASRLASHFPDRFLAYAFLAVPYVPLHSSIKFEDYLAAAKQRNGYETFGYWLFFSSEEADNVIKQHIDSFASVIYPHDPALWKTKMGPIGALRKTLLEGFRAPLPAYFSQQDAECWKEVFLENGFAAPTRWCKIMTNGMEAEDDRQLPPGCAFPPADAPIFFGAATKDYMCVAADGRALFGSEKFKHHNVTIRDFEADHWLIFSHAEDICRELESWIEGTVVKKATYSLQRMYLHGAPDLYADCNGLAQFYDHSLPTQLSLSITAGLLTDFTFHTDGGRHLNSANVLSFHTRAHELYCTVFTSRTTPATVKFGRSMGLKRFEPLTSCDILPRACDRRAKTGGKPAQSASLLCSRRPLAMTVHIVLGEQCIWRIQERYMPILSGEDLTDISIMDTSLYKHTTTSRGIGYNYYAYKARQSRPTLLFLHGFPSTAKTWQHFVSFFKEKDYGIIAPDMLGYGDTDKPTDPSLYVSSKVSKDLVDILDAEQVDKAIVIGHDWGSKAASRLASYFPDRFIAYAFLAMPYVPLHLSLKSTDYLAALKQGSKYEMYGYWFFFSSEEADGIIKEHIDSFVSVLYPHDPVLWKTKLAPVGVLRKTLLEDFQAPLPAYFSQQDAERWKEVFLKNGFVAPNCWYKIMTNGMEAEDDKQVPLERAWPPAHAPIFFGAATKDYICATANGHALLGGEKFKHHNVTIRDFEADHWLMYSHAEDVCRELESWIESTVFKKAILRLFVDHAACLLIDFTSLAGGSQHLNNANALSLSEVHKTFYKSITTSRGLKYTYWAYVAQPGEHTLLFCHGYPGISGDWSLCVSSLQRRGYGFIIPDMLGYGETDKPTDPSLYVSSKMTKDLVEILDAEKIEKVIAIGHDWGAKVTSRFANFYPNRVKAYAFLTTPYVPLFAFSNYDVVKEETKKIVGYNPFGYWTFMSSDGADETTRQHIDSYLSVIWPVDPKTWLTKMAPEGALEKALDNNFTTPLPPYLTPEYVAKWKAAFLPHSFTAPNNWYTVQMNGMEAADELSANVPPDRMLPPKDAPIFFAACSQDYICAPKLGTTIFQDKSWAEHDITIVEYDTNHWLMFTKAEEVCADIDTWVKKTVN